MDDEIDFICLSRQYRQKTSIRCIARHDQTYFQTGMSCRRSSAAMPRALGETKNKLRTYKYSAFPWETAGGELQVILNESVQSNPSFRIGGRQGKISESGRLMVD